MKRKDVVIKKSKIQRKGLFANRNFKKGEVVLKWKPEILNLKKAEIEELPLSKKHYIYKTDTGKYFLMQSPERYLNHSCDPNTEVRKHCDIAKREIKRGEEITSDYNREGSFTSFICLCNSAKCAGFVKRPDLKK